MSGLVYIPIKRTNQSSPISTGEWDSLQTQLRVLFSQVGDGTGTVTSVGLSGVSGIITVSSSPITTSGTIALSLNTQSANRVFAGPTTGSAAAPTFRALVIADIPTITVAKGGTGVTSFTASRVIVSDVSGNLSSSAVTSTTLSYLDATSSIQTQIDSKEPTIVTLAVNRGGTGATTAQGARVALLPSISASTALYMLRINAGKTDVEWVAPPGGIASINADTTSAQTIVAADTGTDFTISTVAGVTTVAIPSASSANRGLVTISAQTFNGQKTFTNAPIFSTLTATRVLYAGGSKEAVGDAGFTRVVASAYSLIDEMIQNKITVLTADTNLSISHQYISSEHVAATTYTLPTIGSVPLGKLYFIKDTLGVCATHNLSIEAQGGDLLETVANGTKTITTNFGAIAVRAVSAGGGTSVWSVVSSMGTIT